ncbi:MAG: ABC transporter substrate-binding protein [Firmicutes bacterium]|nr:ABC transporter substrate-binding protein [Bacillota bacterium]
MKKFVKSALTLVVALVTVLVLVACNPDATTEEQTLVVGSPEISGNFMAGFGNSAYDVWVRDLINGYGTYATTPLGEVVLNETVVKTVATAVDTVTGDKTYTFVLQEDLLWSDDEPIMADDFVFAILMSASKEWVTAGASSSAGDSLVGYTEYRAGTTSADVRFKGVKLLGDYSFSVTISGEELPYYYETLYAAFGPMPMHVLAPAGASIDSNADGAKVGAGNLALLADVAKIGGYRYAPVVSAGPYKFVSFVNQVVTLVKDDNFKGNYEGKTPTIQNVIIKRVNQTLDVDLVISGEIDLVTGVIEGSKIQAAQAAASTATQYYSRNGYGLLAMQAHFGPTMDYKVRQAIAYLTDRQYVTDVVLDGYGSIVYSEYGLAQWMYVQSEDWVDANINKYAFSVTQANTVLDTSDYKFESNGTTPFNPALATAGSNYFRHNAAGEVLEIRHFGTENNMVTDSLQAKFEINMQLAGIKYDITIGDFATLLDHYYYSYELDPADKQYHIFNLATNFSVAYDPYYSWHSDWLGTWYNAHQLEDSPTSPAAPLVGAEKTLDELTTALRTVEPGNTTAYLALWREYQLRWNKLIPNVPLYSNQYYDVFDTNLKGVETTPFWNWAAAINDMYFEG